jgi:integrase
VSLPRKVGREHRYLTHQQVHALAEAAGEHGTLIRVLAYTGLRWGEVSGLRVKDVDLGRAPAEGGAERRAGQR